MIGAKHQLYRQRNASIIIVDQIRAPQGQMEVDQKEADHMDRMEAGL